MAELSIDPAILSQLAPDLKALADGASEVARELAAVRALFATAAGQPGDQIADAFNADFQPIVSLGAQYMTGLDQLLNGHGDGTALTKQSFVNSDETGLQAVNHFRKA